MFAQRTAGRTDNLFLILGTELAKRVTGHDYETLRAAAAQALMDAPERDLGISEWIPFQIDGYGFRAKRAGAAEIQVEMTGEPTLDQALALRGLRHQRDALTDHDGRHTIKDHVGATIGRFTATEAWQEVIHDTCRPLPEFDPSKVTIGRHRMSVTQGEATISYDGQKINRYWDNVRILEKGATPPAGAEILGGFHGDGDEFWIAAARRVITRGTW